MKISDEEHNNSGAKYHQLNPTGTAEQGRPEGGACAPNIFKVIKS